MIGSVALGVGAAPATAATFRVDRADDDNVSGCVTATADDCTLRGAITRANANAGADTIDFGIPGAGTKVISLMGALPAVTEAVTIDGYTQGDAAVNTNANFAGAFAPGGAGSNAVLRVQIDAQGFGALVLQGGGTTVRGLAIHDAAEDAVLIRSSDNVLAGNFLGLTAGGALPEQQADPPFDQNVNDRAGVSVESGARNRIGGTAPADRNVISGNQRPNFGIGIRIVGGSDTTIAGNLIGTNPAGTAEIANGGQGGININGFFAEPAGSLADVVIGGTAAGAGNLVSGNLHHAGAIDVNGTGPNVEVTVLGNRIGTNVTGTTAVPNNSLAGIQSDAPTAIGDDQGHGNLISGNGRGIWLTGQDHSVEGNRIGTDLTGTVALPNATGIVLRGLTATVGGTTPGARNLISGNLFGGITTEDASNNVIAGNFIGTDVTGTLPLANGNHGIEFAGGAGNTVGGAALGSDNVISANQLAGIFLQSSEGPTADDNLILGNRIGTNAAGTGALGNGEAGVLMKTGERNVIGRPGEGNLIAHNGGDGVQLGVPPEEQNALNQFDVEELRDNSIRGNSIFANGGLGIDLLPDGVTANDALDEDNGPNALQNFPALTAAVQGSSTTISGTLASVPGQTFTIDFYEVVACDASGNGEAQTFLGSTTATTGGDGSAAFSATVPATVPTDRFVTATATHSGGSTSELSACRAVSPAPAPGPAPAPAETPTETPAETPAETPPAPVVIPTPVEPVVVPACNDRRPPITSLKRAGVRLRARGTRLELSGTSADHRECPSGVARVDVSLARVAGRTGVNCRFIRRPDRYQLTGRKNCRRPTLFRATGTDRWRFTFPVELRPGLYRVQARGTDRARNKETPKARQNIVFFEVK